MPLNTPYYGFPYLGIKSDNKLKKYNAIIFLIKH